MNVLIASDSYKDSLSAFEVGEAARKGILSALPSANVENSPMADGGEGTLDALLTCLDGEEKEVRVHDPLMNLVVARYVVLNGDTAFIESARSSGLPLVPFEKRDPLKANTYGLGEQIKDAVLKGYRHIVISLGGSATNDGGVGMLQALGWTFYDGDGAELGVEGNPMLHAASFSDRERLAGLEECSFTIASDVTNPFYGEKGAAHIFGRQKGATTEGVLELDAGLVRLASLFKEAYGVDVQKVAGSGAAGGLGGSIVAALNGVLQSGVDTIIELTGLEEKVLQADIVFTGEGSLDQQSLMGKVPVGVARLAKMHGKKVIGIAGRIDTDLAEVNQYLDAVFSIQTECRSLEEAMRSEVTSEQVRVTVEQVVRLLKV
ncbi:glycerate kinase family protein [Rossellomorea vietnamensis]|uniref:glycerate kinase family protein n=1 Tax=Rossellomorea vietnamensis TaxID=218284 RepID=UPI001E2D0966|nr:glycerate kinase [Rossellomorea vietnamensis]MCC5803877.1 glycerate kinase [Rossellomorea vietnamensis]